MKITGKFILAVAIAAMSMDLFAADQPPVCALYKAVLPPNAHPKLVDTVEIAVGPPEAGEPNLFWFKVTCTKVNKDAFTIWFLADGNPFSTHSNRTINFVRYILQEPGRMPIEYVEQRSGKALLPLFYFREKLLPRSITDSNEPLFEKGTFLGSAITSGGLIRSAESQVAPQPVGPPQNITKLVLNPELLIGTGRNFKDDGAGRKSPTDNYNYVPFTAKDYNDMIDAGVNYFTAGGQQIDWICRRAVFYEGYSPGIAFPEELFRSNFMGLVMFIDEPAYILAGKYPKDASPIEAVKMIQQHIIQQRADRSYMNLLREAGIDLGSLELIEPCIPIWETYVDTSCYQLEANPCGIVQECRWQIRPDGSEQTSGRFLQRINTEFGMDIPIEPKNLFLWSYSQMIGSARALGAKWGMAIYGQAEPELRLPSMKLAYDLGAAFIWFWTSDHDHHVPYDEQLALVRAITEYAKLHPRPPLNEILRRARTAVVLPYGYTLPTCWELDMFGSYIFPMSRKNQFGITYKQVLNPAIKEIETLLKNNIPYDVVPASSHFNPADYDEVIRVEENGAVRKSTYSIAGALSPSVFADEGARAEKERWVAARFGRADADAPFSFLYNGQPSSKLLKDWKTQYSSRPLDENRTEYVVTHSDPQTGLVVRCVAVEYKDFPTVEWTLYFKNAGTSDTPILSEIQALDARFGFKSAKGLVIHHSKGGFDLDGYRPFQTPLDPNGSKSFSAAGGRPTNKDMPYFNLDGGSEGIIVAVGWPGQWSAKFGRGGDNRVQITAGQELTRFKLYGGEEVRSPLIVLQFWKGKDWIDAQNLWRRWMMAHSMPKPGGKLPPPLFLDASSRAYNEMINANEENQIMFINRFLEEGLKLDYWWMDAGWYPCDGQWPKTGTWEVDKSRFPRGFKPISDYAHSKGIKILVWFEPERVAPGTWLTTNHPEWIFGGAGGGLLNLGNPQAREWLTNHIDKLLTEEGIDLYRQDFNMDPLGHWRGNDPNDRQGITEILHVTGYLAYFDELIRRHPNMLIDTCSSGGRRLDLETLRRAVPLWRNDTTHNALSNQCQTYGISFWIPYHGTHTVGCDDAPYYGGGLTPVQPYVFWSDAGPRVGCGADMRVKEINYAMFRKLFGQWREISPNYYGDYYPLMPYSLDKNVWIAWQFNRPEAGEGMLQAFRRPDSDVSECQFKLRGLEPDAQYELVNIDTGEKLKMTGGEMAEKGVKVNINEKPGVAVITYRKVK